MSKKHDSYIKILQKLQDISDIRSPKIHEYHFIYSPKKISGPYEGCRFQLKLILHQGFPQTSPQLFFIGIPYHLNINQSNGKFNAAFLNQDWCSFMTFDMIFDELNALLENPDLKYAVCEQMKKIYLLSQSSYLSKIKAWRQLNGFFKNNNPSGLVRKQQNNIKKAKQSQIQSIISFPQSIDQFEVNSHQRTEERDKLNKNKLGSVCNSSQEVQFFSPPLRRKSSSTFALQSLTKIKNASINSFNTSISNKADSSQLSPQVSKHKLKVCFIEQQSKHQKGKNQKPLKSMNKPVNSPTVKLKNGQYPYIRQDQKLLSKQKEDRVKQTSLNLQVSATQKQKKFLQKKQTMQIRNLFKQKSRSCSDQNQGQFSISSIKEKLQEQNGALLQRQQTIANYQTISDFQVNQRNHPAQFSAKKQTEQQKTTRRLVSHSLPSENEEKEILQSSVKTARLVEKLKICQLDDRSLKDYTQKVNTFIRALVNECKYIEKVIESSQSQKLKQILIVKIQQQVQFVQKLQNLAVLLKNSIVEHLATEVQDILSK